jgi:two-component system, sensor histidine kinase and response regulator
VPLSESKAPVLPLPHQNDKAQVARLSLVGAKVLVAEDNLVNLEVARFHLEDLGCLHASAVNGAEAVDMAKRENFDYILMDCQMPIMDGFAALAAIRALGQSSANATAPILAVTAADDEQTKQQCARAGFDGFLSKPFSAEQLRIALLREQQAKQPSISATPATFSVLNASIFSAFVNDFGLDTAPSLIASYVKLLNDSLARFDRCHAENDVAGLQALSHKLAGASGTIGASRLQAISKSIDTKGKARQLQFTPEVCALRGDIVEAYALLSPLQTEPALAAHLACTNV